MLILFSANNYTWSPYYNMTNVIIIDDQTSWSYSHLHNATDPQTI